MKRRIIGGVLCALLLWSALSATAFASEEPATEPAFSVEETELAEDPACAEAGGEVLTETAEALPEETEEAPEEAPAPEQGGEAALPLSASSVLEYFDPEDPMYERAMRQLDGAYGSTYSAFVTRSLNGETLRKGIDVSAWQGTINWTKVAASGVEFVYIRAAFRYGSGRLATDGYFTSNIRGAKAAGLKVGVYVFSQAITTDEAVTEAEYLMDLIEGYDVDLPLVYDLEHLSGGRFSNANLSRRAVTDLCLAFCRRVEQAGYESMVYSNPSMLNNEMYASELGRLWLANYTTQTSYTGHAYEYWQCSDKGVVDGVDGNVDLDFWFQPNSSLTVSSGSSGPFSDVKERDWYYSVVVEAYEKKIVNGMTSTTFEPNGTATRGQVVTMLYRLAEEPAWTNRTEFTDLTQSYYKDAVYWAAEQKVVEGYPGNLFRPEKPITRQELVTILYRMAGEPSASGSLASYADAKDVQKWAEDAMLWATEKGIVTGYTDGTLRPCGQATRAEVCAILMRYSAL